MYQNEGINSERVWTRIKKVIIKTMIAVETPVINASNTPYRQRNNFYEIFGFDIMIDKKLKPWLMEVNVCPSMNCASLLDKVCKTSLICDTMNILGFQPYDWEYFDAFKIHKRMNLQYKRFFGRITSLLDLDIDNCVDRLTVEDWNLLFEFDEEYHRRGCFERIFPNKDNVEKYGKLFPS